MGKWKIPQVANPDMRFEAVVNIADKGNLVGGIAWQDSSGLWHASIDYWWYGEGPTRKDAIQKVLEAYCDPKI
jgi:hypothetical protein